MKRPKNEKSTGVTKTFTPDKYPFLKKSISIEIFETTDEKDNILVGYYEPLSLIITSTRLASFNYAFAFEIEASIYSFLWADDSTLHESALRVKRRLRKDYVTDEVLQHGYNFKYFTNPVLPPMSAKLQAYNEHAAWLKTIDKNNTAHDISQIINHMLKQRKKNNDFNK